MEKAIEQYIYSFSNAVFSNELIAKMVEEKFNVSNVYAKSIVMKKTRISSDRIV